MCSPRWSASPDETVTARSGVLRFTRIVCPAGRPAGVPLMASDKRGGRRNRRWFRSTPAFLYTAIISISVSTVTAQSLGPFSRMYISGSAPRRPPDNHTPRSPRRGGPRGPRDPRRPRGAMGLSGLLG
ncbi:unnamed protein product [Gadus morhua 'NCC']